MYIKTRINELAKFKKEYLLGLRNFLLNEIHSYSVNTWGENFFDIQDEYRSYDVVLSDNKGLIASIKADKSNSQFTVYIGCEFALSIYTLVTAYYSLRKDSNHEELAILDKKTVLEIIDTQLPYDDDDWNYYGNTLDYDHYIVAKENILYIMLFVLYHELSHLSNGHYEFIQKFKNHNQNIKNFNTDFRKFIEIDADISASFNYARRILSYPISYLPNNIPFEYPRDQAAYFMLGSIGLLFPLEDMIANKKFSANEYFLAKEYKNFKYPHPTVRCDLVRIHINIAIERMKKEGIFTEDLAELMRNSGRYLILSLSQAVGFTDDRWDLHSSAKKEENESIKMLDWYFDKKDLILKQLKAIYYE